MPKVTIDRAKAPNLPRLQSADIGPGLGRAARTAGEAIFQQSVQQLQKEKLAQDITYTTNQSVRASELVNNLGTKLQSETQDFTGYAERLTTEADAIYQGIIDNAPSEEAKLDLVQKFGRAREGLFRTAKKFEQGKLVEQYTNDFESSLNILSNQVKRNPEEFQNVLSQFDELLGTAPTFLGKQAVDNLQSKSEKVLAESFLRGLAVSDPSGAKEALAGGQFDKLFDSKEQASLQNAINTIENKVAAQVEQAYSQDLAAIDERIIKTKMGVTDDPMTFAEIEQLDREGFYLDRKDKVSHLNKLYTAQKEAIVAAGNTEIARHRISNGLALDLSNKEVKSGIDQVFVEDIVPQIQTAESEVDIATAVNNFVNKTKFLPKTLEEQMIRQPLVYGSPDQRLQAARLAKNVIDNNPVAQHSFKTEELADIATLNRIANISDTPEQAIEMFEKEKRLAQDPARKEQLNNRFSEVEPLDLDAFDPGLFVAEPGEETIPAEILSFANDIDRQLITMGTHPDDVPEIRNQVLKAKGYGITTLGSNRFMQHTPEATYGLTPGEVNELYETDLEGVLPEGISTGDTYVLPNSFVDEDGFRKYFIGYNDEFGIPRTLHIDGDPVAWHPDSKQLDDVQSAIQEREIFERRQQQSEDLDKTHQILIEDSNRKFSR
jgi:hypothetical protein